MLLFANLCLQAKLDDVNDVEQYSDLLVMLYNVYVK